VLKRIVTGEGGGNEEGASCVPHPKEKSSETEERPNTSQKRGKNGSDRLRSKQWVGEAKENMWRENGVGGEMEKLGDVLERGLNKPRFQANGKVGGKA